MIKEIIRRNDTDFTASLASNEPGDDTTKLTSFVRRLYWLRGETNRTEHDYMLSSLLSPMKMKGMAEAQELLVKGLLSQEKLLIVGDFDADGATSTALLYRCLKSLGYVNIDFLVPNRFEYGYGLTPEIVDLAIGSLPDMIITVDNGISSVDGVQKARDAGIKVLITDHHLPGKITPNANAIVNPNQHGCEFPSKNLAGVGVIYYVMLALRARLRELAWFVDNNIPEPNMAQFLDLVALGTVADVVPLDFNNRILVSQGLKRIRQGLACAGILSILKVANKNAHTIVSSDLGFAIGPRLNAAGRLDDMSLGIKCLLSDSPENSYLLAQDLDDLNTDRKLIEAGMQKEALKQLDSVGSLQNVKSSVCLFKSEWHQGVIGIIASRVKDRMHRPTIIFADAQNGELKGSGRSIPGVHLRDVLDEVATQNPGLLTKFGGHAMAAGLSLPAHRFDEFVQAFDACVECHLTEDMKRPIIYSDGSLGSQELSILYAQEIKKAGPWGQHFPEPIFDGVFRIVQKRIVGEKHLKLVLGLADSQAFVIDAIAFNVDMAVWQNTNVDAARLVYKLDINEYRGQRSAQLIVDYIEPA